MNPQDQQPDVLDPQQSVIATEHMFLPTAIDVHIANQPLLAASKRRRNRLLAVVGITGLAIIGGVLFAVLGKTDSQSPATVAAKQSTTTNIPVIKSTDSSVDQSAATAPTSAAPAATTAASKASSEVNKAQAQTNINTIADYLDSYLIDNGSYPADLNKSYFTNYNPNANVFTAPAGTRYVYTPIPAGCTTAGQDCSNYTLTAVDAATGTVLVTAQQPPEEDADL